VSLTRLVLKGFQRHEHLDLKLDPHVTTIVGPSDSGKSSVIRALQWAATNKPNGSAFIRKGSKKALVTLYVDGHKVTRRKGGGKNTYSLDAIELKAFGASPPSDVNKLLNIDAINVQTQHSPYWYFSLSPGQVAKELNAIVDLSIIDQSLAYIAKQSRDTKAETAVVEKRIKEARAKRKSLRWVNKAIREWNGLLILESVRNQTKAGFENLERLTGQVIKSKVETRTLGEQYGDALLLVNLGEAYSKMSDKVQRLTILLTSIEKAETAIRAGVPDISKLEGLMEKMEKTRKAVVNLEEVVTEAGRTEGRMAQLRKEVRETEEKIHSEWTGKACPYCGGTI
jgi:exonuclease SbcC